MNRNLYLSQEQAVAGVIDPDAQTAGTLTSGWISMNTFGAIQAIVCLGTAGSGATVDAKLQQATDASGTGAKDITSKAITQLTGTDDDKQAVINCAAEELDVANNFTHARLSVTLAGSAADIGALVMGGHCPYGPASDNDISTVDEIVT